MPARPDAGRGGLADQSDLRAVRPGHRPRPARRGRRLGGTRRGRGLRRRLRGTTVDHQVADRPGRGVLAGGQAGGRPGRGRVRGRRGRRRRRLAARLGRGLAAPHRLRPAAARGARRAVPAGDRRRPGGRGPRLARPQLPIRRRPRPARLRRRGHTAPGGGDARRARRDRRGPDRPAADAGPGCPVDPGRAADPSIRTVVEQVSDDRGGRTDAALHGHSQHRRGSLRRRCGQGAHGRPADAGQVRRQLPAVLGRRGARQDLLPGRGADGGGRRRPHCWTMRGDGLAAACSRRCRPGRGWPPARGQSPGRGSGV